MIEHVNITSEFLPHCETIIIFLNNCGLNMESVKTFFQQEKELFHLCEQFLCNPSSKEWSMDTLNQHPSIIRVECIHEKKCLCLFN